ncbi:bacteriochlorophyll 4-vinyl reductase [Rhodobacteraceae bacterium XHP0102]|nr:bacteriochlorophyll 4-vinyl reductase [Rhodobacteraceae bacterium XHP0102]
MSADALIGPNAILQLIPVLDRNLGEGARKSLFSALDTPIPSGDHMIPEQDAARVHQGLRANFPQQAAGLSAQAGRATADYIITHRIPAKAQILMGFLPANLAARALSVAIARNAWTFAGSGRFHVVSPWEFQIQDNPVISGETSDHPLCHWHAAVFERLYRRLVCPDVICRETACSAMGADSCRFALRRV